MNCRENFANCSPLQLAIRELREIVALPTFWIGFACVMAVLAVSAPFDSGEEFTILGRVVYWTGLSVATFFPALVIIRSLSRWINNRGLNSFGSSLLAGAVAGVPIGIIVFLINSNIAGNDDGEIEDFFRLIGLCTPIAVAVAGLQFLLLGLDDQRAQTSAPDASPVLMARMSKHLRGRVLTLQSQDHYVEVVTDRGRELLLMRLTDAIAEVREEGMRVHRSWWVARAEVADLCKAEGRHELVLRDGRRVPVSRANQRAVTEWLGF